MGRVKDWMMELQETAPYRHGYHARQCGHPRQVIARSSVREAWLLGWDQCDGAEEELARVD